MYGVKSYTKRGILYHWLKEERYKLIFLQDTHCSKDLETNFNKTWKGEIYHSTTSNNHKNGVAILLAEDLDMDIKKE